MNSHFPKCYQNSQSHDIFRGNGGFSTMNPPWSQATQAYFIKPLPLLFWLKDPSSRNYILCLIKMGISSVLSVKASKDTPWGIITLHTEVIAEKEGEKNLNLAEVDSLKPLSVTKTIKVRLKNQRTTLEMLQSLFVFSLDLGVTQRPLPKNHTEQLMGDWMAQDWIRTLFPLCIMLFVVVSSGR